MRETCQVAILLLIFNRADLTQRVFERIRAVRPKRLFIAADGPRAGCDGENQHCQEARNVVSEVDWSCEVQRLYRDTNLGCKVAVSTAISWFFEHVEEGIILEDDCFPDLSFFPYCAELLERYRHQPQVAMISGSQLLTEKYRPSCEISYYFSKYPHIWGWATWRRTWRHYDANLSGWSGNSNSLNRIANGRVRRRFGRKFDAVKQGRNDTWDYQLVYQCLTSEAICVTPTVNLVRNIGFDDRATHTIVPICEEANKNVSGLSFPLVHPYELAINERADFQTETRVYFVPPNLLVSLVWSAKKRLSRWLAWLRC